MSQSLRPEAGQTEEGEMIASWGKVLEAAVGVWEGGLQGALEEPRRRGRPGGEGHLPGSREGAGEAIQMRWTVQGNAWSPAQGVWESGGLVSGHRGARPWKGQTRSRKETGSRPASQWHWELGKGSPRETELEACIQQSRGWIKETQRPQGAGRITKGQDRGLDGSSMGAGEGRRRRPDGLPRLRLVGR